MVMLSVRKTTASVAAAARTLRACCVCALAASSCFGEIGQVEPGVLSLQLQSVSAVQLNSLQYTVSHERGFVRSGPVAIGDQQIFAFKVDTLTPAYGYVVSAYAEGIISAAKVSTVCTGQASFEIRTAQATAVSMRLQCEGVTRTGTSHENKLNTCPTVSVISAEPAEAPVGQEVQLRAESFDDSDGPLPVEYQWSASSGVLSTPGAAQTRFLCNRAGVVAVHLTLSDGDDVCGDSPASVYVTCTDDDCKDLTHCPNSPVQPNTTNSQTGLAGSTALPGQAGQTGGLIGAAGRPANTGAAARGADKDAGTVEAGSGGAPSWPWPDEQDQDPPPRGPRGRRDRDEAGSGGRWQATGGAGAGAPSTSTGGQPASQPEAGAAGSTLPLAGAGAGGATVPEAGAGGAAGTAAESGGAGAGGATSPEGGAGGVAGAAAEGGAGAGGEGGAGEAGAAAGSAGCPGVLVGDVCCAPALRPGTPNAASMYCDDVYLEHARSR